MKELLKKTIEIACSAPSGANLQPWTYLLVHQDEDYYIIIYKQNYGLSDQNEPIKHYYVHESVALSAGFLIETFHLLDITYELCISHSFQFKRPVNESLFMVIKVPHQTLKSNKDVDYLYETMNKRRSVRRYEEESFNKEIIERIINDMKKRWQAEVEFKIISDLEVKQQIRNRAEENEKRLYEELISKEWEEALSPLGTNWKKVHLTEAPYLVIPFSSKERRTDALIACGMFIYLLHLEGYSTLPYTPSPMNFLKEVLNSNSEPLLVFPCGKPSKENKNPAISRKPLNKSLICIGI